jgi:hypothetical protein
VLAHLAILAREMGVPTVVGVIDALERFPQGTTVTVDGGHRRGDRGGGAVKAISWFAGGITLVASGAYVFIYLYRWEWHRALFVAVVFVAVEVAMATGLVLRQLAASPPSAPRAATTSCRTRRCSLGSGRHRPDRTTSPGSHGTSAGPTSSSPPCSGAAWCSRPGAWAIDRLAHRTAGPAVDRSLAVAPRRAGVPGGRPRGRRRRSCWPPTRPYHDEPDLRLLLGPQGTPPVKAFGSVLVVLGVVVAIIVLREATMTRHTPVDRDTEMHVVVEASSNVAGAKLPGDGGCAVRDVPARGGDRPDRPPERPRAPAPSCCGCDRRSTTATGARSSAAWRTPSSTGSRRGVREVRHVAPTGSPPTTAGG